MVFFVKFLTTFVACMIGFACGIYFFYSVYRNKVIKLINCEREVKEIKSLDKEISDLYDIQMDYLLQQHSYYAKLFRILTSFIERKDLIDDLLVLDDYKECEEKLFKSIEDYKQFVKQAGDVKWKMKNWKV